MEDIMAASKNINYFLIDGKSDGRIKCTIQNWIGLFYKVPRTYLDECKNSGGVLDRKLIKDYLFNNPSYAATFVLGKSSNGRTEWKDKDGVTLKEIEEKEIDG